MTIRDLEEAIADIVTDGWARQVDDARNAVLRLWSARDGQVSAADIDAILRRLVLPRRMDAATLLLPAAEFGNEAVVGATAPELDPDAVDALSGVEGKAGIGVAETSRRIRALDLELLSQVLSAVQPLVTSVSAMRAQTSWAVNYAANSATTSAAAQKGVGLVWVPERDACVICTSYAGQTNERGSFGGMVGFDGEPVPAVPWPPVHPHCRCELHEWAGDRGTVQALQREAVRSILRGTSLPSESMAARLRAARNALTRGFDAPASVRRVAEQALERGSF